MLVFDKICNIKEHLSKLKSQGKTIGFVPTMGTLHQGHLSLIKASIKDCDLTVCSIFVNPIQFNNKEDLEKYPRMFAKDKNLLEAEGCDIIFNPNEEEMYPGKIEEKYDFGVLEKVMEGAFRPGHFNGVAVVVKRLFDIVEPDYAYFGEKDFQQLAIVKELAIIHNLDINIIGCKIIRESDGLAMSSRNLRLNEAQRKAAPFIYKQLCQAKENAYKGMSPQEVKDAIKKEFASNGSFELEYVEIANPSTLLAIESFDNQANARIFIAAYLGEIRLIDNIEIYS